MATCGQGGICYVKNDGCREFTGTLNVTSIDFASGNATVLKAQAVSLPAGPGAIEWFNLTASPFLLSASTGGTGQARQPCAAKPCGASHPGRTYCPCDPTAHQCDQTGKNPVCKGPSKPSAGAGNAILRAVVAHADGKIESDNTIPLTVPEAMNVSKASITAGVGGVNLDGSVSVTVASDVVAVWVTLTTRAHGRFEDNAFVMQPGSRVIKFFPWGELDMATLKSSLRVEDLSAYKFSTSC